MIKFYLSSLMGKRQLKIADVARENQLPRSTIEKLYKETAMQVDLVVGSRDAVPLFQVWH